MNNNEAIEILELFNYQAKRLKNSRLYQQIKEKRLASIQVITKKDNVVHTIFHDEDAINAFILPLRFLIQDNERCSLHNLAILYDEIPVSINVKEDYHLYRNKLNEYLEEETTFLLPEEELSRRKILEVFVYGYFSHSHKDKKELLEGWMNIPIFGPLIFKELIDTIIRMHDIIQYISNNINKKAIEALNINTI